MYSVLSIFLVFQNAICNRIHILLSQTGCPAGYVSCNESRNKSAAMRAEMPLPPRRRSDSGRIFEKSKKPRAPNADGVPMSDSILSYITDTFHAVRGRFSFAAHFCRTVRFYFRYPPSVLKLSSSQASICTTAKYRACRRPPSVSPRGVRQVRTAGLL